MSGELLIAEEADALRSSGVTYDGVGLDRFRGAVTAVMSWQVQRRAGVGVRPSNETVIDGAVAVLRLGWGVVGVSAPVRVVYVLDEERRKGFAYGTLPGHPESGEEAFVVTLGDDRVVTFEISAFSRPATLLARAGGPVARAVQGRITDRYLQAL